VILLILVQAISVPFLWTLNAVGIVSEERFAVFLAVGLLSFAMVAYVHRRQKWGELLSRSWILVGSFGLIILLLSSCSSHKAGKRQKHFIVGRNPRVALQNSETSQGRFLRLNRTFHCNL
jgi:hypothetical protein